MCTIVHAVIYRHGGGQSILVIWSSAASFNQRKYWEFGTADVNASMWCSF